MPKWIFQKISRDQQGVGPTSRSFAGSAWTAVQRLSAATSVHCVAYRCPWMKNIASKSFTEDEGFDRIIFHKMRLDTWYVQCNFFAKVFILTFCWAKSLVLSVYLHVKQALNVKAVNNLFLSFKLFIFHWFDKLDRMFWTNDFFHIFDIIMLISKAF